MEKFGIFELLDALSVLTAKEDTEKSVSPSATDNAFAPPKYSAPDKSPDGEENAAAETDTESTAPRHDALSNFYARHDAVARKAKK